jgi:hypothetical protein
VTDTNDVWRVVGLLYFFTNDVTNFFDVINYFYRIGCYSITKIVREPHETNMLVADCEPLFCLYSDRKRNYEIFIDNFTNTGLE